VHKKKFVTKLLKKDRFGSNKPVSFGTLLTARIARNIVDTSRYQMRDDAVASRALQTPD
jgi:hypothetical protein